MGGTKQDLSVLDSLGILGGRNACAGSGLLGGSYIVVCGQGAGHPGGLAGGALGLVGN